MKYQMSKNHLFVKIFYRSLEIKTSRVYHTYVMNIFDGLLFTLDKIFTVAQSVKVP